MKIISNAKFNITLKLRTTKNHLISIQKRIQSRLREVEFLNSLKANSKRLKKWVFKTMHLVKTPPEAPLQPIGDIHSMAHKLKGLKSAFDGPNGTIEEQEMALRYLNEGINELEKTFNKHPQYSAIHASLSSLEKKMDVHVNQERTRRHEQAEADVKDFTVPEKLAEDPAFFDELKASTHLLGEALQNQLFEHIEGSGLWKDKALEAVKKMNNRPAGHELSEILDDLNIPRNSALARELFRALT